MDPTCVLCADCFKKSQHRYHKYVYVPFYVLLLFWCKLRQLFQIRYKIATSAGGGYCDCGDPEAWKKDVHCESHKPKSSGNEAKGTTADQKAFERRATLLLPSILLYAFELTVNELERVLPPFLRPQDHNKDDDDDERSSLFCTVLYNDETHTFDLVIQTLTRALQCTKKDAIEFATTIDREGRSIVKVGGFNVSSNLFWPLYCRLNYCY